MDLAPDEIRALIARATELKTQHRAGTAPRSLEGKVLAMIFTKASTRTRVSFEAGMAQLGGSALFLSGQDTQLGRGEPIADSARVISSMVDIVMIRTFAHADVEDFAAHSSVPRHQRPDGRLSPLVKFWLIYRPYFEINGDISGRKVCWLGDGNNVCHSWMNAARQLDFELVVGVSGGVRPRPRACWRLADSTPVSTVIPLPPQRERTC
jgi:ornithine carbamoyltransferase